MVQGKCFGTGSSPRALAAAVKWCLAIATAALLVSPLTALDGDTGMHDPSTVVQDRGKFYVYGTGAGLPISVSDDGWTWRRNGTLIPAGDAMHLKEGEVPEMMSVRFRTLGCSPCTGAVGSCATTLEEIAAEAGAAKISERSTRIIDHGANTMEDKKREGYF